MKNEIQKSLPGIPSVADLSPDAKKAIFRETVKRRLVRAEYTQTVSNGVVVYKGEL